MPTRSFIEGRKYWLNGWVKDCEKGKFLSLSAKADEEPKAKPAARDWQRPCRRRGQPPKSNEAADEEIQMMDLD